jgi:hypothetical protein
MDDFCSKCRDTYLSAFDVKFIKYIGECLNCYAETYGKESADSITAQVELLH